MASNIHSHQHLMDPALMVGPALMAGAHAENGVLSPHIFHFNHCVYSHTNVTLCRVFEYFCSKN